MGIESLLGQRRSCSCNSSEAERAREDVHGWGMHVEEFSLCSSTREKIGKFRECNGVRVRSTRSPRKGWGSQMSVGKGIGKQGCLSTQGRGLKVRRKGEEKSRRSEVKGQEEKEEEKKVDRG